MLAQAVNIFSSGSRSPWDSTDSDEGIPESDLNGDG